MARRRGWIVALSALLAAACCVGLYVTVAAQQRRRLSLSQDKKEVAGGIEQFARHRSWLRVNSAHARMDGAVAALCRAPTVAESGVGTQGPHRAKYLDVYVNDLGAKAMTGEGGAEFPRGSIIVKEKLPRAGGGGGDVELMTAMVKREAGYNPEAGDWEFFVLDGAGKQVQARGRLENCMTCHVAQKAWDYTFRSYLPPDALQRVRQQAEASSGR
ncbi:MAG: cytochrome P460 family protein [Acidobacteria bacterium]|nr:cytochrome P460 family protein [Acidobacteriota bacterium]